MAKCITGYMVISPDDSDEENSDQENSNEKN